MLAIRNFGHYWNRELVDWGKPGRGTRGNLQGYVLRDRQPFVVDFRDQMGIYVLFTGSRDVVYIGQVGAGDQRLFDRLRNHTRNHLRDRWQHFSWFGLREVNLRGTLSEHQKPESRCLGTNTDALSEVEAVLVQLFEPRLNKQGPRWGENSEEFLQYVPWEWDEEDAPLKAGEQYLSRRLTEVQDQIIAKIDEVVD